MAEAACRYAPLLDPERKKAIRYPKRDISPRAVSDFLEGKISDLTDRRNSLLDMKNGALEARDKTSDQAQLEGIIEQIQPVVRDLRVLKHSKRVIEQDIEEEVMENEEKRARKNEPGIDFLERAYANSLVLRIMGCSAKKGKGGFNKHYQARFRVDVLRYYNAILSNSAWCVVSGRWYEKVNVKAAHLVPKSLSPDELAFLFGANETVASNPRNGLPLHKTVEVALDRGQICIVPIIPLDNSAPRWKCILLDEGCRHNTVLTIDGQSPQSPMKITWDQLDQRELEFRGCNRPARRFLYLRFIITYLYAKVNGNTSFTNSVESRKIFWASEGQYLHHSTLCSLARNISGLELPEALASNVFEDTSVSDREADSIGASLAADLHRATVESVKEKAEDDDSEDDDSEGDDSEEDGSLYDG